MYLRSQFSAIVRQLQGRFIRPKVILCSNCFKDRGLAYEARKLGEESNERCPECRSSTGFKLSEAAVEDLTRNFFIYGSYLKTTYGGASLLKWGNGDVKFPDWLACDVRLLERKTGLGFRYNGPRTFQIGEVYPLDELNNAETRDRAADEVVRLFPRRQLKKGETFYRLRKGIELGKQSSPLQFDSPPDERLGDGRLDTDGFPVLYGSQDLEICVHECRVTKADECHIGVLESSTTVDLLDLSASIEDPGATPFESLSLAIHFVFAAESHSYQITRAIAKAAKRANLQGVIFPSYFSSLRGATIENIAVFGRPVEDGRLNVVCINRLLLQSAKYDVALGPCLPEVGTWWADEANPPT